MCSPSAEAMLAAEPEAMPEPMLTATHGGNPKGKGVRTPRVLGNVWVTDSDPVAGG